MLAEGDGLGEVGGVDMAIGAERTSMVVDGMAVAEGALDTPEEHVTLHGTPATTTLDEVFGDCPTCVGTDDDNIGLITLAKETSLTYLEETGRIMTHEFDETFQRENTLIDELEHRDEGELYHGHATGSTHTATLFLREEMGGVVSTYHCDATIVQGLTQGITIALGLDGRVAFDAGAKGVVVAGGEVEVGDGGLGGNVFEE